MPSGKIDRRRLPDPGPLRPGARARVAPRGAVEETLAGIWCEVLGVGDVGVHDDFFELGGDSLVSIRIIARAARAGVHVTPEQFFDNPCIAGMAAVAGAESKIRAEQEKLSGPVPLTPIQHWFFDSFGGAPHHWNQALLLEGPATLESAAAARALDALIEHHDALRLCFEPRDGRWHQRIEAEVAPLALERIDLSGLAPAEQARALADTGARLHASLDLARAPLVRAALFSAGPQRPTRLLLIGHHLIVDPLSLRTLHEDLDTALRQINRGEAIALPPKTTSFKAWAERLQGEARSTKVVSQLEYWLAQRADFSLPLDDPGGVNSVASATRIASSLPAEQTRALLLESGKAYNTQVTDLLLSALAETLCEWSGSRSMLAGLEGHGREPLFADADLSRTVGWFTTFYPVALERGGDPSPGARLVAVKEQIRGIPARGIGYGMLRYLDADDSEALAARPPVELSFNYLGQVDGASASTALLRPVAAPGGEARGPEGLRPLVLEVNAAVHEGALAVEWTYSSNLHRAETIERLAARHLEALRALIAHCCSGQAGKATPSDFPLAGLDKDELDRLANLIDQLDA